MKLGNTTEVPATLTMFVFVMMKVIKAVATEDLFFKSEING